MLFQERAWQKSQGKPVGPTVLYFGCRNKAQDYIYQDELEDWEKDCLLTLHTAFSRDQKEKRYVTHCLRETGHAVWDLLDSGAHLYVCGDAKMMAKVIISCKNSVISYLVSRMSEILLERFAEILEKCQKLKQKLSSRN